MLKKSIIALLCVYLSACGGGSAVSTDLAATPASNPKPNPCKADGTAAGWFANTAPEYAWIIPMTIKSGYPVGEVDYEQVDAAGNVIKDWSITGRFNSPIVPKYEAYDGNSTIYTLDVDAANTACTWDTCKTPSGYVHVYIRTVKNAPTDPTVILKDFGISAVSGCMSF